MAQTRPFLTAEWRYLAMLNYEIEPVVLAPYVPPGVELDFWNGRTYVSMVGFLFLDTRVRGIAFPFHRDFTEVNLRFYVRRHSPQGWRRGVVFVKEIVPRWAIAALANWFYGEKYVALRMQHAMELASGHLPEGGLVEYAWRFSGEWNRLGVRITGEPRPAAPGSEAEFITEHYWGYAARPGGTVEYRVEHPSWRLWQVGEAYLDCDAARLYGPQFAECLQSPPTSAFLAEGSEVAVYPGGTIY